ncbi:MAG: hypothetical protein ABJ004_02180 [Cyclobacteriaceae bacterium]
MDFLYEYLVRNEEAITASLVASALFTLILFSLRPRISISSNIAKYYNNKDNQIYYLIKIKNRSVFFRVYEVKAKLYKVSSLSTNNTSLNTIEDEIELKRSEFWMVSSFYFWHFLQWFKPDKRLNQRTDYCCVFGTKTDLEQLLKDNKHVMVEVYARHPLSGFARVSKMVFQHDTNIKEGHFLSGNTFRIM